MSDISKFWSPLLRDLEPYVPGEQPRGQTLVKLNTNENPYPPAPGVTEALTEAAVSELRLYPDPATTRLKQALAAHFGVAEAQLLVGNGSDEVLAFAFQAFFKQDRPVLFPDITYGFYPVYCNLYGIEGQPLPLAEDFSIRLADYRQPNGGIIFPNPNAPTGIGLPLKAIEALLQENRDSVVIVDEAYVDFGAESAVGLVSRYPNLLVMQTLSKSRSLAGARIGFAVGDASLIAGMERVRNSFNPYSVDRLAERAAVAAIEDDAYFRDCRDRIIATRAWTAAQLKSLDFGVLPSSANFLLVRPPAPVTAEQLYRRLREHNILVRYFNKPRITDYLRISIGTDGDMAQLVEAVKAILTDS